MLEALVVAARAAGAEILKLVEAGFEVETKSDQSPVTICDRAAEQIILDALRQAAPGVPVIAEEEVAAGRIPAHGDTYFLVDPLDGTKEFVRGGDDYTVNIGLIVDGRAEARRGLSAGASTGSGPGWSGEGAFVEDGRRAARQSHCRPLGRAARRGRVQVALQPGDRRLSRRGDRRCATMSRSARSSNSASSPKGSADIYPRLSPTSEWDTAAGHAVLLAAGGRVDGPDGAPLAYGKKAFLNRGLLRDGRMAGAADRTVHGAVFGWRRFAGRPLVADRNIAQRPGQESGETSTLLKELAGRTAPSLTLRQFTPAKCFEVPLDQVKGMHKVLGESDLMVGADGLEPPTLSV